MKTIILIFLIGILFSEIGFAEDSFLRHAEDRGITISVTTDKTLRVISLLIFI